MTEQYYNQLQECHRAKVKELAERLQITSVVYYKVRAVSDYIKACIDHAMSISDELPSDNSITQAYALSEVQKIRIPSKKLSDAELQHFHDVGITVLVAVKAIMTMEQRRNEKN